MAEPTANLHGSLPAPPGGLPACAHAAHCRRVAAWSVMLGARMGLAGPELSLLEQAAFQHHAPGLALGSDAMDRLFRDLRGIASDDASPLETPSVPAATDASDALQASLRDVLAANSGVSAARVPILVRILDAAHALDDCIEALPYGGDTLPAALQALENVSSATEWRRTVRSLREMQSVDESAIRRVAARLPAWPRAAAEAYRLSLSNSVSLDSLERAAGSDAVIAGLLIKAANAAAYAQRSPVRSLRQAVSNIGLDATRRILAAASLRPLFAARHLQRLWDHALLAAACAESLAAQLAVVDPTEAFLAGLVHDVGRLALLNLPRTTTETLHMLIERGVETVPAELLLCGCDHGHAGAIVLDEWRFDEAVIEAVRHHHQPERTPSALASLLYLTEHLLGAEEDLASAARLHLACSALGTTLARIEDARTRPAPALQALRFPA